MATQPPPELPSPVESKDPEVTTDSTVPETEVPSKPHTLDMFGKVSSWFSSKEAAVVDVTSPVLEGAKNKVSSWFASKELATNEEASTPTLEGAKSKVAAWFGGSKETSGEDQASPVTPVVEGAKTIGNILYSAVNKAGQTVSEAGVMLKKTVEESSILGEFNKEQESFIQEKQNTETKTSAALPPWVGHPNEKQLKAACLQLSKDKKNFTRNPPPGVDFEFDYATQYPVAMVTLSQDKQLETMRFELVPAVLNEATFWRNYFYRVSLISQANELSSLEAEQLLAQLQTDNSSTETTDADKDSSATRSTSTPLVLDPLDFVSDSLDTKDQDLDEIREEVKKLFLTGGDKYEGGNIRESSSTTEEDWEKELDAEIQEFELVTSDRDLK